MNDRLAELGSKRVCDGCGVEYAILDGELSAAAGLSSIEGAEEPSQSRCGPQLERVLKNCSTML